MGKIVQRHTSATNPETHEAIWFEPGDELPAWAEPLVTNPKVFAGRDGDEKRESIMTVTSKAVNYMNMNITALDELLKERDLSTSGNKAAKVERLKAHDDAVG
jgi:hypothetical protein